MLCWGGTCDEDVVDVCVCSRDTAEDLVHETLECLSSIAKSKGHLDELEESEWGGDGCLGNVRGGHWNLVECTNQVQLGEYSGTL